MALREPHGREARGNRELDFAPADFGPFRVESLPTGIVILWFDDPDRKVNLLDSRSLDLLQRALGAVKVRATDPRALILASGKHRQFIAGADVTEFDRVETPAEAETKV
ncbi:MAG TPA: hypothetical protein VFV24_10100, partial [Candidatus Eisenbacteria bacterium]|nr:hypothetical protein [Candidatus Eisenbacteria bacterium]